MLEYLVVHTPLRHSPRPNHVRARHRDSKVGCLLPRKPVVRQLTDIDAVVVPVAPRQVLVDVGVDARHGERGCLTVRSLSRVGLSKMLPAEQTHFSGVGADSAKRRGDVPVESGVGRCCAVARVHRGAQSSRGVVVAAFVVVVVGSGAV